MESHKLEFDIDQVWDRGKCKNVISSAGNVDGNFHCEISF